MKRLLFSLLAILCIGLPSLRAEEFVLGGCNHKVATNGYGSDGEGSIAAAMYIPGNKLRSLAGNDISRIEVGLSSRINVRNLNVWVRKSLDGENLAIATIERPAQGWNTVTFNSPYTIESDIDGLYVGYDYENSGSSHPASFIGNGSEYNSYLRINNGKWEDMSEKGALSIEAVVTGNNLPQYDLALITANIYPNMATAVNSYTVTGVVSNLALKDVKGFTFDVKVDGNTVGTAHISMVVEKGATRSFNYGIVTTAPLQVQAEVVISAVDGGQDADMTNNSAIAKVSFPKNVVVEEFTTERCVNCPNAANWFNNALNSDPTYRERVVPVCHHSAFGTDWLTRDCDTELLWLFNMDGQSFAPAAMFNRHSAFRKGLYQDKYEPIVALRSQSDFEDCIKSELQEVTHAMVGISIEEERMTDDGTEFDIKVSVITDEGFSLSNPVLVFYTLENEVQALRQEGASGTYYHHHVIRTDNGNNGENIDLTTGYFSKTYTVTLDPTWKRNNLYFAAFVANSDPTNVDNNMIENGAVLYLSDVAAVGSFISNTNVKELYRYDAQGVRHEGEFNGINIVVYSDGTVKKIYVNK